ncbi:hypothetical protein LSAT2_004022 [Lamellibrachia satsuma]|nr:hypothetical protein LSAT2_004022 [Lamellibrachia satsuma]
MPPIKESAQQSARTSAAVDVPTQRDVVEPRLEQVSATAGISGAAATNAARCGLETDMESALVRISATEQLGREMRRELGEIRELLQAALPNAANVAAAAASCSQETTMATTNTGIVGSINVLPGETQGNTCGVATIALHACVSEKTCNNRLCMLTFDHVPTIAS